MFAWMAGQKRFWAWVRPPGHEYRHVHHHGHVCKTDTLEVRDRMRVVLLLPIDALWEVDETHALAELFPEPKAWVDLHVWLYRQGLEPKAPEGVTHARPRLTGRDERMLRGEGLKLANRGLVDMDYLPTLDSGSKAWMARFLEHTVENRWRYDGQDLVVPRSPLARSLYADYGSRQRCVVVLPERDMQDG